MTQMMISAAKDAVATTGIELTYANMTFWSCADDDFSAPSYGLLNAGFAIAETPEQAQAQIDGWAPKLVAAGWTQTPLSRSQDVEVKDRIFAKDDLVLFLTPWAKTYRPNPPNVFTVRTKCVVDTDARPAPQDSDVLPQIIG